MASGGAASPKATVPMATTLLSPVSHLGEGAGAEKPPKVLPPGMVSLVKVLSKRLEAIWRGTGKPDEVTWSNAIYDNESHLKRRPPNEIEAVLATMDQTALQIIEQNFGSRMPDLHEFAQAIVRTGTYDADGVLGFIGGVVDLFLEVLWSQADRAVGPNNGTVRWGQLMNHFIESPEIAMFEGTEITAGLGSKARASGDRMPQIQRSDTEDRAKHLGSYIEKLYWLQHLDSLVTVEGTESVYFWTPSESIMEPKCIQTPQLKDVPDCFDENDKPLYTVLATAWDGAQDLVALLSNRLLVVWRLRSREKFQFRQRVLYRMHASKTNESRHTRGDSPWRVCIKTVDPKGESLEPKPSPTATTQVGRAGTSRSSSRQPAPSAADALEREERGMRLQMKEDRDAKDIAYQLDLWYNTQRRLWVTTDKNGKLCFWDLLSLEGTGDPGPFEPKHEVSAHKRRVTAYQELGQRKFVTGSLDRTVVLWDTLNCSPEHIITDHTASVLDLAYLSNFYSLISVGCEKRVYVWSIDSTAYRGLTAKLSGHQANLVQVASGNDQRGRAFFTLDEAFVLIVWDVATLSSLQTLNTSKQRPRHVLGFSNMGRLCLAGRRFYFYEGNELMALNYMGATPSKEQLAKAKKPVAGSFKERAKPRWCGINAARGTMVSVTEAEVRVHARGNPAISRVIFCLNEGEVVTSYATMDSMHLTILGTSKGAIYFLKCRSGCTLRVYQGRLDGEAWEPGANAPIGGGGGGGGGGGAPSMSADVGVESSKARVVPSGQRLSGTSPAGGSFPPSPMVATVAGSSAAGSVENSPGHGVKAPKSGSGFLPGRSGLAVGIDAARETMRDLHSGGSRPSDILTCGAGLDISLGAGDGAGDNQAEEEELAQELHEVREVIRMGYSETDARRALQHRRKFADAVREWQHDEEAQEAYEAADSEAKEKTWEDLKAANIASNIETAVEKLLSGAIVTTATEELPARMPMRAMDGAKEAEEEKVRPRRSSFSQNAPSPDEIAKGLTRRIQCVLPVEEQKRIYVGTEEGQVLVCACDPNFTILRWITQPGPNVAAVTCLDAVYEQRNDGPWGLLLVGTQEGSAHLYGLPNLRLAGSINIGRILPEANPENGDLQLRHVRLLRTPRETATFEQFPFAILTIDRRSRFRLWGIRMHGQSGKLEELALFLDGGQLPEIKEELVDPNAALPADAEEKSQKAAKATGSGAKSSKDEQMRPAARVTTVCAVNGQVVLPLKAVPGALPPGAVTAPVVPASPGAFAALAAAFAASSGGGEEPPESPKDKAKVKFEEPKDAEKCESSGTEEDDRPETLQWRKQRQKWRPSTPNTGADIDGIPYPPQVAPADGAKYIFFGDAVGRIWCLDAVGSACAAHEQRELLTVLLDENAESPSKSRSRQSIRFNTHGSGFGNAGPGSRGGTMPSSPANDGLRSPAAFGTKQSIPAPAPEALKIATSWQAHEGYIVSLVPTTSPPALVSTDGDKHVRVWSTCGELWGHFQLAGVEPGCTFSWPPPHVLAAQHALMRIAKSLCKRMGLRTSGVHIEDTSKKSRHNRRSTMRKASGKASKDATTPTTADKKAKSKPEKRVVVKSDNDTETPKNKYMRKKGGKMLSGEGDTPFMTEPRSSPTATPTASESETGGGTTADEAGDAPTPATKPVTKRAPAPKAAAAPKAEEAKPPKEMSEENLFDDDDELPMDGDEESEPSAVEDLEKQQAEKREQFDTMVRNRGFSSGFKSYQHFQSKHNQKNESPTNASRTKGESLTQLHKQRNTFFKREAADFGVLIGTRKDAEHWSQSTRSMGSRSCSEGALLRYAQAAVAQMTRSVYDELGVDVSKTEMKQLRKPSFVAALDVRPEVTPEFFRDPSSATAQAVQKILPQKLSRSASAPRRMTALHSAGNSVVGSGKSRHR